MKNRAPFGGKPPTSASPGSQNLSRREWLRAAGMAAAASPFLGKGALAQGPAVPPLRLICWPLMNGADDKYWYPGGTDATVLSPITEPLRKYASLVTYIKGVSVSGATNHQAIRATYSGGSVSSYTSPDPTLKSVDILISDNIAQKAPTPQKVVHLGVIPADDLQYYHKGQNIFFYDTTPVDYEANPVTAYDRLFGGAATKPPMPTGADYTNDSLDILDAEMNELGGRLTNAATEINKFNLHRNALKGLRPSAMSMGVPPAMMNGGPLPAVEKLRPALLGNPKAAYKYEYFSDTFDAQLDIIARVLITGMSRVITLQAGSADNDMIVPVDGGYPHHVTSHGDQATFTKVQNYYFGKMARLLASLDVPDPLDPGKTVLDNSLIVMMSECLPQSHSSNNVPVLLVGKLGGKVRTGSVINASGSNNKNLMATVCKAFGTDPVQFGTTTISGVLL